MNWGSKLVQGEKSLLFIGSNSFLMPYSLLSVVQHSQSKTEDNKMSHFYTEDYYKLDG